MSLKQYHARRDWESNKEQRIQEAVGVAEWAFWAAIANNFPEITTGDVTPESAFYQKKLLLSFVREWIENNECSIKW